jgi:hypothetical protein
MRGRWIPTGYSCNPVLGCEVDGFQHSIRVILLVFEVDGFQQIILVMLYWYVR